MIIRFLMNKRQIEHLSAVVYFLDAYVLFMAVILLYSFIKNPNMVKEFIVLASIVLLPIYIFIFVINRDIHSKENLIDKQISRLRGSKFSETEKTSETELISRCNAEKYGSIDQDELNSILNAGYIFNKKIKIFETYSKIAFILVVATLCILPFLSIIGLSWGWK